MKISHSVNKRITGATQTDHFSVTSTPVRSGVSVGGYTDVTDASLPDVTFETDVNIVEEVYYTFTSSEPSAVIKNNDPLRCSIVGNSVRLIPGAEGSVPFVVATNGRVTMKVEGVVNMQRSSPLTDPYRFKSHAVGTLSEHINSSIEAIVGNHRLTKEELFFTDPSSWDPVDPTLLKRNPLNPMFGRVSLSSIAVSTDLDGIQDQYDANGVRVSQGHGGKSACAITPRHCLAATHFTPSGNLYFIGEDGVLVTRTIVGNEIVMLYGGPSSTTRDTTTDLRVLYLDADLPPSVVPAKLMPENYRDYLFKTGAPIPIFDPENAVVRSKDSLSKLYTIQHTDRRAARNFNLPLTGYGQYRTLYFGFLGEFFDGFTNDQKHSFRFGQSQARVDVNPIDNNQHAPMMGNLGPTNPSSGSAITTVVNGDLVYLGEFHDAGGGAGPCKALASTIARMNNRATIHNGPAHQPSIVDLSAFKSYASSNERITEYYKMLAKRS